LARRTSNKRTRVENSLEASVNENAKLLEIARGSYEFKTANIAAKRQKMELKAEQDREGQRYAAEERALAIKERMQDKEFEHRERMIKYELELARLKAAGGDVVSPPGRLQAAFQGGAQVGGTQVGGAQVGGAQVGDLFPSASGLTQGFQHTNQAGIYPTSEGSTFGGHFPFSTQPSSVSQSPDSEVWGLSGHEPSLIL
jgi:hypothetical protein